MLKQIVIAIVLLALTASAAAAQGPVALELRGGAAFPTEKLGDADLKTGGGFEASALVQVLPFLGVYGGWGMSIFSTDTPFRAADYDIDDSGYIFGVQLRQQVVPRVAVFLRGGGTYRHIEMENSAGDIVADSGHELGWQAGGGMNIALTPRLVLTPGVTYRALQADLHVGQVATTVDLGYVAAEVGLAWTPGAPRRSIVAARR